MIVREAVAADIDGILAIEAAAFSTPWSRESFEEEIGADGKYYLVAEAAGEIIGYGGFWKILEEGHVTNIAVKPASQGRGIGRAILEKLLEEGLRQGLERFTLEVRISNAPAIKLYECLGFESAGQRPGFYANPREAALIMWKELKSTL